MRFSSMAFPMAILTLVTSAVAHAAEKAETGYRTDTILILEGADEGCGTLLFNADGTYENGYAWRYGGIIPPDYGAFVECFTYLQRSLCSAIFDLTTTGDLGAGMDIVVYDDAGGVPGAIVFTQRVDPGTIAVWPSVSRHTFSLGNDPCPDTDTFWVGYWGNWPGGVQSWFIGADLDGFGGCPFTNIAPGIGYPTGWNNVSVVWGPTQALGIGAEGWYGLCGGPIPVVETTWGQIKHLYDKGPEY